MEQGWTEQELGIPAQSLFTRRGEEFQLAHRADGACVFLTDDGLCRIHAKYGEPAKPLACRLYPFQFVPLGNGEARVDLRFDCPSAAANRGRPISAHRAQLLELAKKALPEEAAAQECPPLHGRIPASWQQVCRITDTFERVLLDVSLDITRRVAACAHLIDLLRQADEIPQSGADLSEFLDAAASIVQEDAVNDSLARKAPDAAVGLAFRQLAAVYGRIDQVGEKAQPLQRLNTAIKMASGKGRVPRLRPDLPDVAFADLEKPAGIPTGDAALTIERYLHVHLSSMGFFGRSFYNRSFLDGMAALLLTYPLACWFARVFAVGEGLAAPDVKCFERALSVVDHQHGITPVLDIPTERRRAQFLGEPATLRTLIVWYGS